MSGDDVDDEDDDDEMTIPLMIAKASNKTSARNLALHVFFFKDGLFAFASLKRVSGGEKLWKKVPEAVLLNEHDCGLKF